MNGFPLLLENFVGNAPDDSALVLHFFYGCDERNHDLSVRLHAFLLGINGSLKNGTRLHFGDLGVGNAEPAAAMAKHGVELV